MFYIAYCNKSLAYIFLYKWPEVYYKSLIVKSLTGSDAVSL